MSDYEKSFITPDYSNKFLYKMSELWSKECLCDAILKVGEVEMKLHKLVLISASPLLVSHSNEISEKILTITLEIDGDAGALKEFLSYLYYGSMHLTEDNITAIEAVAKLLKVEAVIDFCAQFREMFNLPSTEETDGTDDLEMGPTITQNSDNFGIKLGQSSTPSTQKDDEVLDDFHIQEGACSEDDLMDSECVEEEEDSVKLTSLAQNTTLMVAPVDDPTSLEALESEKKDDSERNSQADGGSCNFCGKTYSTRATLKRHERMHSSEMQCNICHAAFQQKSRLREHMEKHKTDQPFQCHICEKKFRSREWMMKHIRFYHEGKTLYNCSICNKRFIQKSKFDVHYASKHYKVTLYVCKKCGKSFSNAVALTNHQMDCFENGEMFICELCSKTFSSKKYLDQHTKGVHVESRHICLLCGKTYCSASVLRKHQKQCHDKND